jgi:hypothetical protein
MWPFRTTKVSRTTLKRWWCTARLPISTSGSFHGIERAVRPEQGAEKEKPGYQYQSAGMVENTGCVFKEKNTAAP